MILRVFRAVVHAGREAEFERFFLETALPLVRSQPGLLSAEVGRPHAVSPREFCMVMLWQDLDALRGFAGEDWDRAVIHPDEAHLLEATYVHHYDPAQPEASAHDA